MSGSRYNQDRMRPPRDYGVAECIDCGIDSPRLLAPHIPHICSRCLFPPSQPDPRELPQALLMRAKRTAVARDTA